MSGSTWGVISAVVTLGALAVVLAIAVFRVVRSSRRGARGRAALRDGLGPIAASGAAQSEAFGWTPASPAPRAAMVDDGSPHSGNDSR